MLKGKVEEGHSTVTGLTDLTNFKIQLCPWVSSCGKNGTQTLVLLCVCFLRSLAFRQHCCVEVSLEWKARIRSLHSLHYFVSEKLYIFVTCSYGHLVCFLCFVCCFSESCASVRGVRLLLLPQCWNKAKARALALAVSDRLWHLL